jgi:hypothetical protein
MLRVGAIIDTDFLEGNINLPDEVGDSPAHVSGDGNPIDTAESGPHRVCHLDKIS